VSLLDSFIALNRSASRAIEARLPILFKRHLHTLYKLQVADMINQRPGQVTLDLGAGKECPFLPFVRDPRAHFILGVDCSERELRHNGDLDFKIVADAADGLPFKDGSIDVVVSRSVVEHIKDNQAFFANCARVLRSGGLLIHTFPGKFTPFSIFNQVMPNAIAKRLLAYFHPQWKDECGFIAYYDHCYFSAIRRLLNQNGFDNIQFTFRYYQSIYYDFFFPLYALMLLYDIVMWLFRIRNLACGILVTASRGPVILPPFAKSPHPSANGNAFAHTRVQLGNGSTFSAPSRPYAGSADRKDTELSEITEADRKMALKLLKTITSEILRENAAAASNDNCGSSTHTRANAGGTRYSLPPAFEAALATIAEIIASAREEGRNARERELLALTDRDFILISRKEYDRLNSG
jgi:ubiquinone/menaquinone biosynthesis C-methylase UbiE